MLACGGSAIRPMPPGPGHFFLQLGRDSLYAPFAAPRGLPDRKAASFKQLFGGPLSCTAISDASAVVRALAPDEPVILNRPRMPPARAARFFVEKFPGQIALCSEGKSVSPICCSNCGTPVITHFDVASIAEVRLVRATVSACGTLCFMHPVKTASAPFARPISSMALSTFSLDTPRGTGQDRRGDDRPCGPTCSRPQAASASARFVRICRTEPCHRSSVLILPTLAAASAVRRGKWPTGLVSVFTLAARQ